MGPLWFHKGLSRMLFQGLETSDMAAESLTGAFKARALFKGCLGPDN